MPLTAIRSCCTFSSLTNCAQAWWLRSTHQCFPTRPNYRHIRRQLVAEFQGFHWDFFYGTLVKSHYGRKRRCNSPVSAHSLNIKLVFPDRRRVIGKIYAPRASFSAFNTRQYFLAYSVKDQWRWTHECHLLERRWWHRHLVRSGVKIILNTCIGNSLQAWSNQFFVGGHYPVPVFVSNNEFRILKDIALCGVFQWPARNYGQEEGFLSSAELWSV